MIIENVDGFWSDLYRASILFSVLLMLIFVVITFQKKFHRIPAIYWGISSFILVGHFLFFALWEYKIIKNLSVLLVIVGSLRVLVVPLLYLSFNSYLKNSYSWSNQNLKLFLPSVSLYAFFIPILIIASFKNENFWEDSIIPRVYFFSGQLYICLALFHISMKNFLEIKKAPQSSTIPGYGGILKNSPLIGYVKYMSFFFIGHAILILFQLINHLIYGLMSWTLADKLEQYFWLLIGLIFVYKFISYPASLYQFELKNQEIPSEKYQGEMMNLDEAQLMIKKINEYMLEEKPFLYSHYSITQLSTETGIPSRELSKVMNQFLNQNFHDYINNFRVEEFKSLVKNPENQKYSILSLSMDAGFQSKSTFNAAFKKFTGKTPSQYCKNINS